MSLVTVLSNWNMVWDKPKKKKFGMNLRKKALKNLSDNLVLFMRHIGPPLVWKDVGFCGICLKASLRWGKGWDICCIVSLWASRKARNP